MQSKSDPPVIRFALEEEAAAIHAFLYTTGETTLWVRDLPEVEKFVSDNEVVIGTRNGVIMSACYVTVPDDAMEWELGGGRAAPEWRGTGLFTATARAAIANTILHSSPERIISHVVMGNPSPIVPVLEKLGFEPYGDPESHDPEKNPGLRKMPRIGNMVVAQVFELVSANHVQLVEQLYEYVEAGPRFSIDTASMKFLAPAEVKKYLKAERAKRKQVE